MNVVLERRRKGFSLAEAMMATVVLGIAAAGVLLPFTAGAAARAEGNRRTLASMLAADLVERIIGTGFDKIDANMVAGYYGYSEAQGHVKKDAGGPGEVEFIDSKYANFSRTASWDYKFMPEASDATSARFILVTVKVYYNGKEIVKVDRLVSQ